MNGKNTNMLLKKTKREDIDLSNGTSRAEKDYIQEIRKINLGNDTFMRLMEIEGSPYVDVRKFYIDHYTQRGLKIPALKFATGAINIIHDIEEIYGPLDIYAVADEEGQQIIENDPKLKAMFDPPVKVDLRTMKPIPNPKPKKQINS